MKTVVLDIILSDVFEKGFTLSFGKINKTKFELQNDLSVS